MRRASKLLGAFSLGVGAVQLAKPEAVNHLIGVKDTPKTRAIQRALGVQEITAGQGIFSLSPPTPVLWSRVAGDVLHLGLLAKAHDNRRNDHGKLRAAFAATLLVGLVDTVVAVRFQARWPKEPTGADPLPTTRASEEPMREHYEGHPAITIRATEERIRPLLQEFEIEEHGSVSFRRAPGDRGTEVVVETNKKTDSIKADLRRVKQLIEVGEVVRSDAAPDGASVARQLKQRPGQPLEQREPSKLGGGS